MSSSVAEWSARGKSAVRLRRVNRLVAGLAVAVLLAMPLLVNPGLLYLVGMTLILAVYSVGWNVLFSWAGLASFGSGGLFCIGAYVSGLAMQAGWGGQFLAVLLAAGLVGGLVAGVIALIALRRTTGIFLAILTLSLAELLRHILMKARSVGAEDGISGIGRPVLDLGLVQIDLTSGAAYYYFICAAGAAIVGVSWWMAHGPIGRAMLAARHDVDRAGFVGINAFRTRVVAFTVSGVIAAMAGAIYAPWAQIVTPELAGMLRSTQPILFTLLGGLHSFWGPVIGAFAFMLIDYATRTLIGIQEIITGGILLAVVLVFRAGLAGGWTALLARFIPDTEDKP